jgi:hypothetical protein
MRLRPAQARLARPVHVIGGKAQGERDVERIQRPAREAHGGVGSGEDALAQVILEDRHSSDSRGRARSAVPR